MDESAVDQHHHRSSGSPSRGRLAGLRHWSATVRTLGARWRAHLAALLALLGHSVRRVGRYVHSAGGPERSDRSFRTSPAADVHTVEAGRPRRRSTGQSAQLARTRAGTNSRQLPGPQTNRRRLPSGDGRLQVDQTAERLILSDPEREEAYLASTFWVDIEE